MKSAIALPSRRNSGFETTAMSCRSRRTPRTIASTRSPVSTGTVDLLTTTVGPSRYSAIVVAADRTLPRSARPSGPDGVPTAMKTTDFPATAAAGSVGETQTICGNVACDQLGEAGLVDRDAAGGERRDPGGVDIVRGNVAAELGKACRGNQADIACTEDTDPVASVRHFRLIRPRVR